MNRVFLSVGPLVIYWYSVLIVSAVLIGTYFASRDGKKNNLGKEYITDLIFYLVPVGIIGARIYYVIFNFDVFNGNLVDIFKIWEGGLAIYGTVIASIIFIIYYAKKKGKDILLTIDTLVPYLILGQAIGRWGNFFNQEAHGAVCSLSYLESLHLPKFIIDGMYINGSYYIPTFLFESIFCFIGFIILVIVKRKNEYNTKGLLLYIYSIWYGITRLIIEGMRTDSLYLGSFRISQIVSIIFILFGVISIVKKYKSRFTFGK